MNPADVSPGIGGFLAFFLLACALWLLMRSMLRHLRGVDHREQLDDERRRAEQGVDLATRPTGLASRPERPPTGDRGDGGRDDGGAGDEAGAGGDGRRGVTGPGPGAGRPDGDGLREPDPGR